MDTIAKQKALADRVYGLLGDFNPLLAGGAPRDWHVGQAARDLDFYIKSGDPFDPGRVAALLGIELNPLGGEHYDELFRLESSLLAAYEGEFYGQKVQFMFLDVEPLAFIKEKFDISVCKVWYKDGEVCMDWEARLSFRENLLVMKDGFNAHADKLMQRDPWGTFAFMGSWGRALDLIEEVPGRGVGLFDRRDDLLIFQEDGEPVGVNAVPDPQANEVAF